MTAITIAIDETSILLGIAIGLGLPDLARRILSTRLGFGRKPAEPEPDE